MRTPPPITLDLLRQHGACADQCAAFERLFGAGPAPLTTETVLAHASVFDWGWAASHLLPPRQRKAYDDAEAPAWKAYDEATAPAQKAYDEAMAPARKAFREATAPAWKAYDEATAPARKAYDEAVAPAQKAFREATALAFLAAYQST